MFYRVRYNFIYSGVIMKIIFIGCVEFSQAMLKKIIESNGDIVGVVTKKESSFNNDFVDLSVICKQNDIPYIYVRDINSKVNIDWIKDKSPDIIFCFGWSYLLKKGILNIAPKGVLGFHPTLLPKNRGRHPIIWALVLGLKETGSTFFFMDEGADSGDILSQEKISIRQDDNARTLYNKIIKVAGEQIKEFLPLLVTNKYERIPQDNSKANYWRKRTEDDGLIDFGMGNKVIHNLIRGLTHPYCGAHIIYEGKKIKIWEDEDLSPFTEDLLCSLIAPDKRIDGKEPTGYWCQYR